MSAACVQKWLLIVSGIFIICDSEAAFTAKWPLNAPAEEYCDDFCGRLQRLCRGDDQCYSSVDFCKTRCRFWSKGGKIGEIVGNNTLHCRNFWLDAVEQFAHEDLRIAGLCDYTCDGGGMCEPSVVFDCSDYCSMMADPKGGDCGPGPWQFKSEDDCMKSCKQYRRGVIDTLDDTLECRILAINIGEQSVYPQAIEQFCPSAGASGGAFCTSDAMANPCRTYCSWMEKFCGQPADENYNCLQTCEAWPRTGSPGDTSGNTLQCRLKYMAVAARSTIPEIPCEHESLCVDPMHSATQGREDQGYVALNEVRDDIRRRIKPEQSKQQPQHRKKGEEL
eukprot:gnl/MRDRNA2_/MRDRNA2_103783_c0_seq1.p1 gnl/MRDRNA2_/MRDRNA2_103783_c0~~gnl/MRDRNA2_/MRDRNA2_103783_c0_seq1.p1  ORF type:complete len:335 (-),score=44.57 gnl/MRDRNA2_/MRDRNA2_103783_c0_seq1:133-1137(-)